MLKVVDIVYYCHAEYDQPDQLLEKHRPTTGFVDFIKDKTDYEFIRHLNYEGRKDIAGVPYTFFKRNNAPWQIPFRTHKYIKSVKPDIIIVHGFVFPLQVIALRMLIGRKPAIILVHHADKPANSIRKVFQKIADRFVSAYVFTSAGIARPWLEHSIIRDERKVFEVLEASVFVERKDKLSCKAKLGLKGNNNFLWVGRLNQNKDPLTILRAFAMYVERNDSARLFMIYQEEDLLPAVKQFINDSAKLHKHIHLIGGQDKTQLAEWYNAADFFISGSHEEGSGYALLEAMSVGCIPVVSAIPAFMKITGKGDAGFVFPVGNSAALEVLLNELSGIDVAAYSSTVEKYFHKNLAFKNIADNMYELYEKLIPVQSKQFVAG